MPEARAGGVRIDVIAPSGAILSEAALARGLARLAAQGCRVRSRVPEAPWLRFAGSDEARLEQVHASAAADDVDLVMVARGGYGMSRLLDRIDWSRVAQSAARGVRWMGFSDFTAFHLALLAETGATSWAGPSVCADFGGEAGPDPQTLRAWRSVLAGQAPGIAWATDAVSAHALPTPVEGPLWGGNLAMVASLAGTRWMPSVSGGILFVEDVAEHPYRVERMLLQLLHAGVLASQRAIVFGEFTDWRPALHDNGFSLETVREQLADRLGIPVVAGLPFGHGRRHAVLGIGRRYRLATAEQLPGSPGEAPGWLALTAL